MTDPRRSHPSSASGARSRLNASNGSLLAEEGCRKPGTAAYLVSVGVSGLVAGFVAVRPRRTATAPAARIGVTVPVPTRGDTGNLIDALAAAHGFRPKVACRSSDYRFMSALVGAGVGVALVPTLALTERHDVTALSLRPQPVRYVGAYLPSRHSRNQTAEALLAMLRARNS